MRSFAPGTAVAVLLSSFATLAVAQMRTSVNPDTSQRIQQAAQQAQNNPVVGASTGLPLRPATGMLPIGGGLPVTLQGLFGTGLPAFGKQGLAGQGLGSGGAVLPSTGAQGESTPQEPQRWPSWVEIGGVGRNPLATEQRVEESRDPGRLLLIRFADPVFVRPHDEKAFYPLRFWDKFRVLAPGGGVKVGGTGRGELLFSDGARIDALGEFEAWFHRGVEDKLEIDLAWASRADIRLGERDTTIWLPDGSELRGQQSRITIERVRRDAPWMEGGAEDRIGIRNWGPEPVRLRLVSVPGLNLGDLAGGGLPKRLEILPGRRSVLPIIGGRRGRRAGQLAEAFAARAEAGLARSRPGGGAALESDVHARIVEEGAALRVEGVSRPSRLRWGGVEMLVPGGDSLRIDPIGGSPFASPEEEPKEGDTPSQEAPKPKVEPQEGDSAGGTPAEGRR
jgi:hypothetical protein